MSKKTKLPQLTDDQMNFLKIAGIGLGAYLVYKTIKKTTKGITDFFKGKDIQTEKELKEAVEEEQKKLIEEGQVLTYPLFTYKSDASQLLIAMEGMGTDDDLIYSIFSKMKNDLDITQLIKDFGINNYWLATKKLVTEMDLAAWIYEEMNTSEIEKLNKILKDNNITYRF
jgi:hypothetical protein